MARGHKRSTLEEMFSDGSMPSGEDFRELIKATVNKSDDGFDKTDKYGLEISDAGGEKNLLSFFQRTRERGPSWNFSFGKDRDDLEIRAGGPDQDAILAIRKDASLVDHSIGRSGMVDIGGMVRHSGRIGTGNSRDVRADGTWHDITSPLSGCHAFEVIAGAGGAPGQGEYALVHAVALNACNPTGFPSFFANRKKRIKAQHAWYDSRCNKLELRWQTRPESNQRSYQLQLRSRRPYKKMSDKAPPAIRYFITQLWFDPWMDGSTQLWSDPHESNEPAQSGQKNPLDEISDE